MEKAKKGFPVVCTRTLLMAPLVAFCALDPLFAASLLYSLEQQKHSASLSEFSARLDSPQFSESKDDDSHLKFTTND
jgi:hypothetical protein